MKWTKPGHRLKTPRIPTSRIRQVCSKRSEDFHVLWFLEWAGGSCGQWSKLLISYLFKLVAAGCF